MTAEPLSVTGVDRRRFLGYLVAGPTLAIAGRLSLDGLLPAAAGAQIDPPEIPNIYDLTDLLIQSGEPFYYDLLIEIRPENRVYFELPRMEVGQGTMTGATMLVADELDARMEDMDTVLSKAEVRRMTGQFTGGSHAIRSLWGPARQIAAEIRARLVTAAAQEWDIPVGDVTTRDTACHAPDGRVLTYGALSQAATNIQPTASTAVKSEDQYRIIGVPHGRIDARRIVTGQMRYGIDQDVPQAVPTVVRRPPTLGGTVVSFDDTAARAMPGVRAVTQVPFGIAVHADTFGQAFKAKDALEVVWGPGTMDDLSDADIREQIDLLNVPPVAQGMEVLDARYEFPYLSHTPLEVNTAIADVREDGAEVWSGAKLPVVALQTIAQELGLSNDQVVYHVVHAGGSFGRRLFFDGSLEAAIISQASGMPVKLLWSRADDIKFGRGRAMSTHNLRATINGGFVTSFEHRMAGAEMDLRHGFGEAITAIGGGALPQGYSQTIFHLTQHLPYAFPITSLTLVEQPFAYPTAALRCVYSAVCMATNEIFIDEIARHVGVDEYEFRRSLIGEERLLAVLDKVATEGEWGRQLPAGHAQGLGLHDEYKSRVAYLMEVDTTGDELRVTRVVAAVDVGRTVNPKGVEAMIQGAIAEGISSCFRSGLHIDNGAVRESSFTDFRFPRMRNTPPEVTVFIMPDNQDVPGGCGELGHPAAFAAAANGYARATGFAPRRFPIEEFPEG